MKLFLLVGIIEKKDHDDMTVKFLDDDITIAKDIVAKLPPKKENKGSARQSYL